MRFQRRYVRVLSVILLLNSVIIPQTVQKLRKRYGAPEDGVYVVRPNVTMKVSTTKDGRVCKMLIEPRRLALSGTDNSQALSSETVEQILDEEVPKKQRGKLIRSVTIGASCTSTNSQDYENVHINRMTTCAASGDIKSVEIIRKAPECQ